MKTEFFHVRLSPVHFIVFVYIVATVISAILISLPWSTYEHIDLTFIEVLFTAVSAISVTGLTVVNTADTFTPFGVTVLAVILQFGGIGMMTLWTMLWIILGKRIGFGYRQIIMFDQNRYNLEGLIRIIKYVFAFAIFIESIGFIYFTALFYFRGYFESISEAMYYASFHSISSYTNAGFDIFGDSLNLFYYDYLVQVGTMTLILLGAIGFPVLIETWRYWKDKQRGIQYRFSLFAKITVVTFVALLLIGALLIFIFEFGGFLQDSPWHEKLMVSLFYSITARNAGLATMDVSEFYLPTLLVLSVLMFIGASPSSVGGGIRTTTFAVIVLAIRSYMKGEQDITAFGRRLSHEDVIKAFIVFTTGMFLIVSAIILIDVFEMNQHSLIQVIFEASSAFGTTGLSMGITADLTTPSKIVIIALMFIGRIGFLTFLLSMHFKQDKKTYRYPEEKIIIG